MKAEKTPKLLILNQMAGPITWELAEDAGKKSGCVALLTGHPDTLKKRDENVLLYPAAPYRRGGFARRALSWLHYELQALLWLWRWPKDIPVLMFSNPPILCWAGWIVRKLRGQRYSVMVHDIYPDVVIRMAGYSEKHPLIKFWRWMNRHAYENADTVMTLGELMAANLEKQFNSARTRSGKVENVYPWVDTDKIKPIPKSENWFAKQHKQADKFTIMYSGNMGLGHDIETILEAAKNLQNNTVIHFMFIGAGPKWQMIKETTEKENLENVTLLPWQPEETLPYSLATADMAVVSLEKELTGLAIPSKGIYYMAAGSVILLIGEAENELAEWIKQNQCGYVIRPGDVEGFVEVANQLTRDVELRKQMGENARGVVLERFWRGNGGKVLEELN